MFPVKKLAIWLTVASAVSSVIPYLMGQVFLLTPLNLALFFSLFIESKNPKIAIRKVCIAVGVYLLIIFYYGQVLYGESLILLGIFNLYAFPVLATYSIGTLLFALIKRKEKQALGLDLVLVITCILVATALIFYFRDDDLILFPYQLFKK